MSLRAVSYCTVLKVRCYTSSRPSGLHLFFSISCQCCFFWLPLGASIAQYPYLCITSFASLYGRRGWWGQRRTLADLRGLPHHTGAYGLFTPWPAPRSASRKPPQLKKKKKEKKKDRERELN
ncbi:hypothetical protein L873DRAFT_249621 [Choiromyces venosus 120613-1]|uniref:Uncharacterized protein n=1 Tax=Choiromyces venosus 120613-1 TaxID=1336337 RepID=A0A3N4J0T4_9PEZI|nr:hypothetical protein L873DRAFT_249621 [Choiromyces venosus 120613-1]